MAVTVLKDCFVSLDGTEFSDHVKQVTINHSAEALDKTAMTMETRTRTPGLKDWSMDIEFFNDYADNSIDEILFNDVGTTVALIVRPTTAAASASNPAYTGTGLCESYQPIAGQVGELPMATAHYSAAGDLTRSLV